MIDNKNAAADLVVRYLSDPDWDKDSAGSAYQWSQSHPETDQPVVRALNSAVLGEFLVDIIWEDKGEAPQLHLMDQFIVDSHGGVRELGQRRIV